MVKMIIDLEVMINPMLVIPSLILGLALFQISMHSLMNQLDLLDELIGFVRMITSIHH
jgi:hypothetical protein